MKKYLINLYKSTRDIPCNISDLLVQSKSGTGKTLIFSTILLEVYRHDIREPQSLILAPTREIAVQIEVILNQMGKFCQGRKFLSSFHLFFIF